MRTSALLSSLLPLALVLGPSVLALDADPAAAGTVEIKTVVVGLAARRGVDEGLAVAMSDVVQGVFTKVPGRTVLGREDINRVLRFESERQAMGCETDSCLSEIAQALDVDRLVTGSMDKVGSSYFIVITEIDARTVEPVGRVQGRAPLDEDKLITAVTELAEKLLRQSNVTAPRAGAEKQTVGALFVKTVPEGAQVMVGGREVGVTPVKVDTLPPGTHEVLLTREGYEPVRVAVPVYSGAVTELGGELAVPPRPAPEQLKEYEDGLFWQGIFGWSKVGTGSLCALTGLGCGSYPLLMANGYFTSNTWLNVGICGALPLGIGLALCGWGAADLMCKPEPPQGEGPPRHQLEIQPPTGQGERQRLEMMAKEAQADVAMPH